MGKNEKTVIPRYFLCEGKVIEFPDEKSLLDWVETYTNNNPGKGLSVTDATQRTLVVLGNEIPLKTSVENVTKEVSVPVLKIELGEAK